MQTEKARNSSIFPLLFTLLTLGLGAILIVALRKGEFKKDSVDVGLKGRKGLILDYLQKHGNTTVPQLQTIAPDVTARTLRRDLNSLEKEGLIVKTGSTKSSMYHLTE